MKTRGLVILAAVMVFFAISCSSSKSESPAPAVEAKQVSTSADPAVAERTKELRETAEKMSAEEKKKNAIMEAKIAFGLEKNNKEQDPGWAEEIKGSKGTGLFGEACEGYNQAMNMSWYFSARNEDSLNWDEVGITEQAARKMFQETGLKTARLFLKILALPADTRSKAGVCGRGEASFSYLDGEELIDNLIGLLKEMDLQPKNIGTTSIELRQLALKDFRARIVFWRNQIATQQASQSDGGALLEGVIEMAVAWKFTPEELGLNKEEKGKLKK